MNLRERSQALATNAPLWLALLFLALFALLPLLHLGVQTVRGPDGFTLEAWRGLALDANVLVQLRATLWLGLTATLVTTQLAVSLVIDRFGLLGIERSDITATRILGVLLLVGGMALVLNR